MICYWKAFKDFFIYINRFAFYFNYLLLIIRIRKYKYQILKLEILIQVFLIILTFIWGIMVDAYFNLHFPLSKCYWKAVLGHK
jgi:hypothetical protein